jgi:hypothetical protein
MTTIQTTFLGPTNTKGSRYKAVAGEGGKGFTLTLGADHTIGLEDNHYRVARELISRLGWFHDEARGDRYGEWYGGGKFNGGYVFVCTVEYAKLTPTANKVEAA